MEPHTKDEPFSPKAILNIYIDMFEKNESNSRFYFDDNVVLDWFGKTVKGNKKVMCFINEQVRKVTHQMNNVFHSKKVAFKETHKVKVAKNEKLIILPPADQDPTTPKSVASTSKLEKGQGDGIHNNGNNLMSPSKKIKLNSDEEDKETIEAEPEVPSQLKYITAEGTVEFHRPSLKKFQSETKWRRPVKLHLGYTTSGFEDCAIYLIIYECNLKCRRNLLKEFCQVENSS